MTIYLHKSTVHPKPELSYEFIPLQWLSSLTFVYITFS